LDDALKSDKMGDACSMQQYTNILVRAGKKETTSATRLRTDNVIKVKLKEIPLESTSQESSVLECGIVTVIDLRFVRLGEISWPAEELLTGQELCSTESVGWAMKEFRYFSKLTFQ
jgi:hypothetical protein